MPKFGKSSQSRLMTCHPEIINVCNQAILYFDFSVLCGVRGKEEQDELKRTGKSRVSWPDSNHNVNLGNPRSQLFPSQSVAVDLAPYPLDWEDKQSFIWLSQVMKQVSRQQSVQLDWGFDLWDWDMPHWQLQKGSYA